MHFSGLGKTPLRVDNAKWRGTLCVLRFQMGIHMNVCLLLRHLSKLHDSGSMPAPNYIVNKYGWSPIHDLGTWGNAATPVWRDIFKSLNFFRSITSVKIGNGATTSFSNDLWLPNHQTTLACQFHALFSHSNRQSASIAWVLASPELNLDLTPRLSHAAENDLATLHSIMASVNLNSQVPDNRVSRR